MNEPDERARQDASEEQAALWAGRLAGDELGEAARRELAAWLQADPQHRTLLANYVEVSRQAERLMPELVASHRVEVPTVRRQSVVPRWWWAGAALAAAAVAVVLWRPRPEAGLRFTAPVAASVAQELADGSRVDLNARAELEVDFAQEQRRVRLTRGEALFAVAKEADRPFVVATPAGEVRVTGTRFNVRLETEDVVEVTVLQGSVVVAGPRGGPAQKLAPGDQLVLRAGVPDLRKLPIEELQDAIAWLQGRVVLDGVTLGEAARRFALYHDRVIEVSPAVADRQIGGAFRVNDLDGFLQAVERMLPAVKTSTDRDGRIHLDAR